MGKQHYWGPALTIAYQTYQICKICPQYTAGKLLHSSLGHIPLPTGPFEVWQLNFTQLSLIVINMCWS